VKAMCAFFSISRAAYYAWVKRIEDPNPDTGRKELVQKAYQASHRTYGYRRVTWWITQNYGVTINHKAVLRLMNQLGIRSVARRRKIYKKMIELETYHSYPNLLNRDFTATRPNQKWVTDVTYIPTQEGWAYLSTIKDLFDNFIVAHEFGRDNSIALVQQNLRKAKQKEKVTDGLILHSDQGQQYTSQAYFVLTTEYNITRSMSRRGNCWDNAPMENFFGHLKEEAIRQYKSLSFEEAQQIIDDYICFYNYERIQLNTRQTPFHLRCLSM
jgi:putative transposase